MTSEPGKANHEFQVIKISLITLLATITTLFIGCSSRRRAHIIVEQAAVSVWDDNVTVGSQIQLQNTGPATARDVPQIDSDLVDTPAHAESLIRKALLD